MINYQLEYECIRENKREREREYKMDKKKVGFFGCPQSQIDT